MFIFTFVCSLLLSKVCGAKDVNLHYSFVTNKSSQQVGAGLGREQTEAYVQESTVIHSYTNGQSYEKDRTAATGDTEGLIVTVDGQRITGNLRLENVCVLLYYLLNRCACL